MYNRFFKDIETYSNNDTLPLDTAIEHLSYNEDGLIPVITQDNTSKKVLMFAWMNKESIKQTLATRIMTYWSRSRGSLWVKGETSGHTQSLISMQIDCDGDALLCRVSQAGAACHTGRVDCFYLHVDSKSQKVIIHGEYTEC